MRVLFAGGGTGGHLYPALAIARALVRADGRVQPYFVGARRGIERDILPTTEFPFTLLDLHPLYRSRPWANWKTLRGMVSALRALGALGASAPPRLIVATGGYASGAALLHARRAGIPYVLQEQNSFAGKTIAAFSRGAREIYVGFPEAIATLPAASRGRAFDTGNPIEPPPASRPNRAAARAAWGFSDAVRTVVLVFGGSQGSAALNASVDAWIAAGLPEGVGVIWGTGRDHFEKHAARASQSVIVRPYLAPIQDAYAAADLALTRSGAMTTAELCAWGIPMLLVPLPTAAADHQTANAKALAAAGAAQWISQAELSPTRIAQEIDAVRRDPAALERLASRAQSRGRPQAAAEIAKRIVPLLG